MTSRSEGSWEEGASEAASRLWRLLNTGRRPDEVGRRDTDEVRQATVGVVAELGRQMAAALVAGEDADLQAEWMEDAMDMTADVVEGVTTYRELCQVALVMVEALLEAMRAMEPPGDVRRTMASYDDGVKLLERALDATDTALVAVTAKDGVEQTEAAREMWDAATEILTRIAAIARRQRDDFEEMAGGET